MYTRRKSKLCVACKSSKILNTKIEKDAKWINDFNKLNSRIGAPIHTEIYKLSKQSNFPESYPKEADMQVVIPNNNNKLQKIYFFASSSVSLLSAASGVLCNAERAYGKYKNSGVVKKNKKQFIVRLCSPQPYLDNNILYPRHLHYFDVNNPNKIYTTSCVPDHNLVTPIIKTDLCTDLNSMFLCFEKAFMGNHMNITCINALKPEVGPVFSNEKNIFHELSLDNIQKMLKNIKKHQPLIVYCYKPDCNAAVKLLEKITDLGYNNTFYYKGGFVEKEEKIKLIK